MAYTQVKSADTTTPYVVELVADSDSDIISLPTTFSPGSTCIVVASSNVYMLNNQKEWKPL